MREVTVRIRFNRPSLGNVKDKRSKDGRFVFARDVDDQVTFLSSWHSANMRFASRLLGHHQDSVGKIYWDVAVDGQPREGTNKWFRRYYTNAGGRRRYVFHEAFLDGQEIGINCVVPSSIPDDDLLQLMRIAGKYRGLSPFKPGDFGHFEVMSIRQRRRSPNREDTGMVQMTNEILKNKELSGKKLSP